MKIGIHGVNGKMGLAIGKELAQTKDLIFAAASVREGHSWVGKRLADVSDIPSAVRVTSNLDQFVAAVDIVIDFTSPDAMQQILRVCQKAKKALMIGTTGFNEDVKNWIERAAVEIPIVLAANTSVGVNILFEISRRVASVLPPDSWDVDIYEAHHKNKVDAPSGTALRLGQTVSEAQNGNFESRKRYPYTNRRKVGDIGFAVIRAGEIVGDHTISFTHEFERLEFSHHAQDRRIFARGALTAARWLNQREAGLYSMGQVLGFDQ